VHKPTPQFSAVPSAVSPPGKGEWTFDGVLRRVLGMSRAAELERATPRDSRSSGSAIDALRIEAARAQGLAQAQTQVDVATFIQ